MAAPLNQQLANNIEMYNRNRKLEMSRIARNNSQIVASTDNVSTIVNGWRGSGAYQLSRSGTTVQFSVKYNFS